MLRAAHSAPSTFISELKRSAKLFGIVFYWFQFSELLSPSFIFVKINAQVGDFIIERIRLVYLIVISKSKFGPKSEFYAQNFFSKAVNCRETAKI